MRKRVSAFRLATICAVFAIAACAGPSVYFRDTNAPWRGQTERACLAQDLSFLNATLEQLPRLDGPRSCGAAAPFKLHAVSGGTIQLKPAPTLRCPMISPTVQWLEMVVQPAAQRHLGQPITEVKVAASYSCRPMNNRRGAKLSEHGFANALDVSGFTLADGSKITLLRGYNGSRNEQAFWREIEKGACGRYQTVLGPRHDRAHRDHFHFDLMQRSSGPYC